MAERGRPALPEQMAPQVPAGARPELPGQQALRVRQARRGLRERVLQAPRGRQVSRELPALRVLPAPLEQARRVLPDRPA